MLPGALPNGMERGQPRRVLAGPAHVQYRVAMTTTPSALSGNDDTASEVPGIGTKRVSTRRGWWSVGLALGAAVVLWVVGWVVAIAVMTIFGGMGRVPEAVGVAFSIGLMGLVIAMLITAMILGVTSIVRAWPQVGQSGRTAAIVLGCIGIVLSALLGWVLLMPYI